MRGNAFLVIRQCEYCKPLDSLNISTQNLLNAAWVEGFCNLLHSAVSSPIFCQDPRNAGTIMPAMSCHFATRYVSVGSLSSAQRDFKICMAGSAKASECIPYLSLRRDGFMNIL